MLEEIDMFEVEDGRHALNDMDDAVEVSLEGVASLVRELSNRLSNNPPTTPNVYSGAAGAFFCIR